MGTYKNTYLFLKTTECSWFTKYFRYIICIFFLHQLLFFVWDNFENRCFLAWGFMFVLLCSFTKKKTGSIFPAFCHTSFLHPYIPSAVQLLKCITIGMHLILVKTTWPRINQWPCLVEWTSRNITTCIIQPNTFYKINSYIAIIISDIPPFSLALCVKFSQNKRSSLDQQKFKPLNLRMPLS